MITLEFKFQTRRYHATKWGSSPNEGNIDWPPAPWRILRAIVHSWKTYHDGIGHDTMWPVLESMCSRDALFRLPPATQSHTRHYMPIVSHDGKSITKTEKVIDAFLVVDEPLYVMWDAEIDEGQESALREVVSDIQYLGRAESWCEARVVDEDRIPNCVPLSMGPAGGDSEITDVMAAASNATLDDLCVRTRSMHEGKKQYPDKSRIVKYTRPIKGAPALGRADQNQKITVVRYKIVGKIRPKITETVTMGDAFKRAAMSKHKRNTGDCKSSTLSGMTAGNEILKDNHAHAFFLATAEDGGVELDHMTVVSKTPFTREELDALASVKSVWSKDRRLFMPVYAGRGNLDGFTEPPPILQRSKRWVSATPYVPSRHPKTRGTGSDKRVVDGPRDQIVRELRNRGFPSATRVEVRGAREKIGRFLPAEFKKWRKGGLPGFGAYSAVIEFGEYVQGPLSLGQSSHYGLGLFRPATDPRGQESGEEG